MNNNTFIHKYIRSLIYADDIVADMTAGNGNDTLFLARLAKKVLAFDISPLAIERTKEKIKGFDNVELHLDSHAHIDQYVGQNEVSLFLFNLGYMPNSEEFSFTQAEESLIAFKKAYCLLKNKGYLIITFYLGQDGGYDEYYRITGFIEKNKLSGMETYRQDKMDAPITLILYKHHLSTET